MSNVHPMIDMIEKEQLKQEELPSFRPGDSVRVHVRVKEGARERIQVFEGVVIRMRRGSSRTTFTVRKMSYGIGVERIFPIHAPVVSKVEVTSRGKVRRSRIYYLRERRGRAARIKERRDDRNRRKKG